MSAALLSLLLAPAAPKSDFSVKDTRAIGYEYALCSIKRRQAQEQAREVILSNIDNRTLISKYPALASGDCLAQASRRPFSAIEMRFPGDSIRYGLADALFAKELAGTSPRDMSGAAPLQHAVVDDSKYQPELGRKLSKGKLEEAERAKAVAAGSASLSRFGECVVRRDAVNSHALLAAKPSSPEESKAFISLQPTFARCLTVGQTFKTNKMMMRGTLAVNYYRLAFAPPISNAGTAE